MQPANGIVATLGTAQTLAWASTYYLPAILAEPMARELGVSVPTVFAAFSLGLVVSAGVAPWAGRAIDNRGGRPLLMLSSLLFAAGLVTLALAQSPPGLFVAWVLLGVSMGFGLYEAAFATPVRRFGADARKAITGITLLAGLASTVGWPLSAWLETQFGWRGACLGAGLHLVVGLPLNTLLPAWQPDSALAAPSTPPPATSTGTVTTSMALLAFVFAATWFTSTAMARHLPQVLQATGLGLAAAVAIGTLVGPAQVAGRLLEFGLLRHLHPLRSARMAALVHPLGVPLLLLGAPAAAAFALLHGAGNGILTIAKGTLPLALFGAHGYGARLAWLMLPARLAQAMAPLAFGLAIDRWRARALWLTSALGLAAFVALRLLRAPLAAAAAPHENPPETLR